ncbi:MAG: DUF3048 domain-containing protein [Eubacteriales bacterium]|jgi:hypothetical protein
MKKKIIGMALCAVLAGGLFAGCGAEESTDTSVAVATETPTPTPTATPEPTEALEAVSASEDTGTLNYLTGEPIEEDKQNLRPFAIMINNLDAALPQSNISNADLLYEAEVEGSITRLMAVFQDPSAYEKIGPVRSARHYYIYMADDSDAIFTHFGWSPQAETIIEEQNLEHLNGLTDNSGAFFRTSDRVAPHNVYVNGSMLSQLAQSAGYSTTHADGYQPNLSFNSSDTQLSDGEAATTINIGFSYDNPVFTYNSDDGLYYRSEYGAAQVDAETGEQLAFKNIIIQQVSKAVLADGEHLELGMFGVTSGTGYYATDGKIIPITWTKETQQDQTKYYTTDGQELKLNPGKTMFEVISQDYTNTWSA